MTLSLTLTGEEFLALPLEEKAKVYKLHEQYLGKNSEQILLGKVWAIYCGLELQPRLDGNRGVPMPSGEEIEGIGRALGKPIFVYRQDVNVSPVLHYDATAKGPDI